MMGHQGLLEAIRAVLLARQTGKSVNVWHDETWVEVTGLKVKTPEGKWVTVA